MLESVTKIGAGNVGNSQGANTTVAIVLTPGQGRYKISGFARHSLADGCKLIIAGVANQIPGGPNTQVPFGPVIADLQNADSVSVALLTATGAADTACAMLYVEPIQRT
jgi:hypothetical protein